MEASQSTTAEAGGNDADEDTPKEIACFYNGAGPQEVPKNVTKLIVGPDVVRIDEGAFEGYESLKEVDMSKALSLRIIAKRAFSRCCALALIKWPPNIKSIGFHAFLRCTNLKEADMSKLHALETIEDYAFNNCSALALVKWSSNLKTIGMGAFACCPSLKEADMSKLRALESIGSFAFENCGALAIVKLPPNLKFIGRSAFYECTSLKEADMSKLHALKKIGFGAFAYCSALVIVKWAPNIKTIGRYAFEGCTPQDIMVPLRHHWFVRKLPFDETQLQSVDMQGNDLKKAIRIKNLYPRATPRLTMDRLVSMYAKSPLTAAQWEDIARSDESVREKDWTEARFGDLQRLEGIQQAYAGSVFNLLHWYAGNGLAENLFVNRKKRK